MTEVHCTYDPKTKGGDAPDGRKVKATLHWVSAPHSIPAEVRLYDHLLAKADPSDEGEGLDFKAFLNPGSLEILKDCHCGTRPGKGCTRSPGSSLRGWDTFVWIPEIRLRSIWYSTGPSRLKDEWTKIQKTQDKRARTG